MPGQRVCHGCHAAYMRGWRAGRKLISHDLLELAEVLVALSAQLRAACPHQAGPCVCQKRAIRGERWATRL
jgi:hypothetical protein